MSESAERREVLRGILLFVIAAGFFGTVDGFSKLLADTQSVGQIMWARYALALPVLLAAMPPRDWMGTFRTARPGLQILRGVTPLTVSVGMILGVRYLPLADATAILFAGPFLVVALSAPLLGERVGPASWIGVTAGFLGVLIVARPGFGELSQYTIFPALAAVFYGLLQLVTRRLGAVGERPTTTLAWSLLVGSVVSTPLAIVTWAPVSATAWVYMVALGLVFGVSQLLLIRAFTHAPAGTLAPFTYFQIVSAAGFGLAVFGDVPDFWTLVGIVLIVSAGVYVVKRR